LFIVANASAVSRQRLVQLLTQPAVQPLYIQFLLGKDRWSRDTFDYFPRIDIKSPLSIGKFISAYIGIAHCPIGGGFVYNSSATAVKQWTQQEWVGEASRMYDGHRRVLNLGYKEIMRLRAFNKKGHELFIHEKMAYHGAKHFFISMTRYPVAPNEFVQPKPRYWPF
jgi:hypothetical protein